MQRVFTGIAALGLAAALLVPAPGADAASRLPCTARMSNPSPLQYSRTDVLVHSVRAAVVTTTAHYKTTNTTHTGTTNAAGNADIAYRISRATRGFRVIVSVVVRKGASVGTCSTSFVPR